MVFFAGDAGPTFIGMISNIKVVIADDHDFFAEGLKSLLERANMEVISILTTGKQLSDLMYWNYHHIVVLLDIELPGEKWTRILEGIKKRRPEIKVIVMATFDETHFVLKARQSGADGYLLKNMSEDKLLQAISKVSHGVPCFPVKRAAPSSSPYNDELLLTQRLTKREKALLVHLKSEQNSQQIAASLNISVYTIKTHQENILRKLRLKNTDELKAFIIRYNL